MAITRNLVDVLRAKLAADPVLAEAVLEESLRVDVARGVREVRKKAGLTQQQFAERVGATRGAIARIEGVDSSCSLRFLGRFVRTLSVGFLVPGRRFNGD